MADPRRILIIKPSSLGDVVHALPAVGRLRARYPHAHFAWVIQPAFAPLLAQHPGIHELLPFPRDRFRGPVGWVRFARWLHEFTPSSWDLVVDFQGLLRSALIGLAARPGRFVGPADAREGARLFYDAAQSCAEPHAVDRNLAIAACAGATDGPLDFPLPTGALPEGVPPDFILLHPFSRGSGKSLPSNTVRRLLDALGPARVLVVGQGAHALPPLPAHAEDWLNRTSLLDLIALLRKARAVISVDSGPMHVAAAVNRRLLAIHTWSDPARVGPWQMTAQIWKNGRIGPRNAMADPSPGRFPVGIDCEAIAAWATDMRGSV